MVGGREAKVVKQESHLQALQSADSTKDCSVYFLCLRQTRQLSNILANRVIKVLIRAVIITALEALRVLVSSATGGKRISHQ